MEAAYDGASVIAYKSKGYAEGYVRLGLRWLESDLEGLRQVPNGAS